MSVPNRSRSQSGLRWAAVLVLVGAGVVLLEAGHAAFGWSALLVALAVAFARRD